MSRYNQTPEERTMYAERARARERAKDVRKRQKRKAEKIAALKRPINKTSPDFRNRLLPVQNLSKRELKAMLAEAVQNTARL